MCMQFSLLKPRSCLWWNVTYKLIDMIITFCHCWQTTYNWYEIDQKWGLLCLIYCACIKDDTLRPKHIIAVKCFYQGHIIEFYITVVSRIPREVPPITGLSVYPVSMKLVYTPIIRLPHTVCLGADVWTLTISSIAGHSICVQVFIMYIIS